MLFKITAILALVCIQLSLVTCVVSSGSLSFKNHHNYVFTVVGKRCKPVPHHLNDLAIEVKVMGLCLKLWENKDCSGHNRRFYTGHHVLQPSFQNMVSAVSTCLL